MSSSWGYLLAFLSGLLYSACAVAVKYIKSIHPAQLVVYRYWAILSFSLPQLVILQDSNRYPTSSRFGILVLAILTATGAFLKFATFRYLPVGEAATLLSPSPAFVTIGGKIFLNESFGLLEVISLLTNMVGLICITGLAETLVMNSRIYTTEDIYGFIVGVASIAVWVACVLLMRKLRGIHSSLILISTGILGIIEFTIITIVIDRFKMHSKGLDQGMIILLGISGWLAFLTFTEATKYVDAGPLSTMRAASDIIFSYVWQILLFQDSPDGFGIFGAVLVYISTILIGFSKRIKQYLPGSCLKFCE